jgi:dTDP-4-amino-4,6-dideoxygalactose transaminase
MDEIIALARGGTFVLEDAAQAIGARQNGVMAGAAGDAGAFSFFPTKNLGGFGDGGMVTTGDSALSEKVAKLRVHGGRQMYHHEMVGTNSRLDALQAAVLRVKLPHLGGWAEGRRKNAALYDEILADVEGVRTPVTLPGNYHVYNQYTLRVERRDDLRSYLNERGIGNGLYYPLGLHLQECFASLGGRKGDLPVTETLTREVVSLPVFPELTEGQVTEVAEAIRGFYG